MKNRLRDSRGRFVSSKRVTVNESENSIKYIPLHQNIKNVIEENNAYVKYDFGYGGFYIVPANEKEKDILEGEIMKLVKNLMKKEE